jgi:hypothetical protein
MSVAMLSHPPGARKVTIEGPSSAIGFLLWIDMEYDPRNLTSVSTLLIGIKHAQIGD